MGLTDVLGRVLRRNRRHPRGAARLEHDLRAVRRMTTPGPSARARLEAELGPELIVELERLLGVPLARPRRVRRAA